MVMPGNGSLDSTEVQQFAAKIGLKLTMAEAEEAVSEMELTEKKDGVVEFDEFWHWFMYVWAQVPTLEIDWLATLIWCFVALNSTGASASASHREASASD